MSYELQASDFAHILRSYGKKRKEPCNCDFCAQARILLTRKRVTPKMMALITEPQMHRLLVEAICLGMYPLKPGEEPLYNSLDSEES